jgi:transcriptional regulator with XRE-family HTH domain
MNKSRETQMPASKLGSMIKTARLEKGLTQGEVAKALGFDSSQFVYMIESGTSKAPLDVLGKLIVILDLDEKEIMNILSGDFKKAAEEEIAVGRKSVKKKRA